VSAVFAHFLRDVCEELERDRTPPVAKSSPGRSLGRDTWAAIRSTLLVLVSAFAGYERTRALYRHAIERGYRFYSFGDAMFVQRE
jgi:hypothetical protein